MIRTMLLRGVLVLTVCFAMTEPSLSAGAHGRMAANGIHEAGYVRIGGIETSALQS
jgi:hypothetical protein